MQIYVFHYWRSERKYFRFCTRNCKSILIFFWNVKLSNFQLKKLKSGVRSATDVTLKFLSNVFGNSNDEKNFHKLLSTSTQVSKPRKSFASNSSANIKLSKNQLHKTGQSGGFLGRLLGPLLKTGLPLMKNVLKTIAKIV